MELVFRNGAFTSDDGQVKIAFDSARGAYVVDGLESLGLGGGGSGANGNNLKRFVSTSETWWSSSAGDDGTGQHGDLFYKCYLQGQNAVNAIVDLEELEDYKWKIDFSFAMDAPIFNLQQADAAAPNLYEIYLPKLRYHPQNPQAGIDSHYNNFGQYVLLPYSESGSIGKVIVIFRIKDHPLTGIPCPCIEFYIATFCMDSAWANRVNMVQMLYGTVSGILNGITFSKIS